MNFTFDGDIAKEYGLAEAILFYNIAFWEKQNRLNQHNCFEGRYWTYNTIKAYAGLFYFISEATIKRALKHLKDEGLILIGNFDEDKFSRTNYYTLSGKGMEVVQNCTTRLGQNDLIGEVNLSLSILNKNTDSSDKNITDKNIPPILSPLENRKLLFKQFWEAYPNCPRKVNYDGCEKKFIQIENLETIFPEIMASLEVWKKRWSKDNNKFVPTTHKWINQKYWTVTDMRTETQIKIDEVVKENSNDFLL